MAVSSRQKVTIPVPATGWADPVPLNAIGNSGLISRVVARLDTGGTVASTEIRIWYGEYGKFTSTVTAAQVETNVPLEDVTFRETGISLTASATVPSLDQNVLYSAGGAVFRVGSSGGVWISAKNVSGSGTGNLIVSVEAVDGRV